MHAQQQVVWIAAVQGDFAAAQKTPVLSHNSCHTQVCHSKATLENPQARVCMPVFVSALLLCASNYHTLSRNSHHSC